MQEAMKLEYTIRAIQLMAKKAEKVTSISQEVNWDQVKVSSQNLVKVIDSLREAEAMFSQQRCVDGCIVTKRSKEMSRLEFIHIMERTTWEKRCLEGDSLPKHNMV